MTASSQIIRTPGIVASSIAFGYVGWVSSAVSAHSKSFASACFIVFDPSFLLNMGSAYGNLASVHEDPIPSL